MHSSPSLILVGLGAVHMHACCTNGQTCQLTPRDRFEIDTPVPAAWSVFFSTFFLHVCLPRRPGGSQVLKPGLVKGQWSAEEDDRLVGLVEKGFRNWGQVTVDTLTRCPLENISSNMFGYQRQVVPCRIIKQHV